MNFLWSGLFAFVALLSGIFIGLETPEEMHNRRIIYILFQLMNIFQIFVVLYFANDIYWILIMFVYYMFFAYSSSALYSYLVKYKYKKDVFKNFPYVNYMILFIPLLFAFYVKSATAFYLLLYSFYIMITLVGILETYHYLYSPRKKYTTETKIPLNEKLRISYLVSLRYSPVLLAVLTVFLMILIY